MAMRIPFEVEVQIVRRRMETTVDVVAEEFGVSKLTVHNIMKRNPELVEQLKAQIRKEATEASPQPQTTGLHEGTSVEQLTFDFQARQGEVLDIDPNSFILDSELALKYQPRAEDDEGAVNDYAAIMREAGSYKASGFPPIRVWEIEIDGQIIRIITDGKHRTRAASKAELPTLRAEVFRGTMAEADADAILANTEAQPRVRMTNASKNRLAERIVQNPLFEGMAPEKIAKASNHVVSVAMLRKWKEKKESGELTPLIVFPPPDPDKDEDPFLDRKEGQDGATEETTSEHQEVEGRVYHYLLGQRCPHVHRQYRLRDGSRVRKPDVTALNRLKEAAVVAEVKTDRQVTMKELESQLFSYAVFAGPQCRLAIAARELNPDNWHFYIKDQEGIPQLASKVQFEYHLEIELQWAMLYGLLVECLRDEFSEEQISKMRSNFYDFGRRQTARERILELGNLFL